MVWSFFTWISKEILKWDSKALLSLPFLRASLSFQRPMVRSLKIPNLSNFVDERIKVISGGVLVENLGEIDEKSCFRAYRVN